MLADLESIKVSVERSLPLDVVAAMREAGIALTLDSSSASQPVVGISDELAERELLEEMVSFRKNVTGVDNTIFISPKGFTRHAARIKLAIDPSDSIDPRGATASIAIDGGAVVAGEVSAELLKQVWQFIQLNHDVLLDYWNYLADTEELRARLKSIK
jgi:NAD(P)H-dependent FMN reductase